jgi:hypothetical protein
MVAIWSVAKALQIPLDQKVKTLPELPYTISYVIRKRMQVDGLNELPKDKRPTDFIIWDGSSDDIDRWLDRVYRNKEEASFDIELGEIE